MIKQRHDEQGQNKKPKYKIWSSWDHEVDFAIMKNIKRCGCGYDKLTILVCMRDMNRTKEEKNND